ncbi:MAG: hypothetical protein ACPGO0_04105, partial [Acidimicrobiales bacterium]
MAWSDFQPAIFEALGKASGVSQVRLIDERHGFDRDQRLEVEFELEIVGEPNDSFTDEGNGILPTATGQLNILARVTALSQSHNPTVSAVELAYRLLTRWSLPEVSEILAAKGLSLVSADRAIPGVLQVDQRNISVMIIEWRLRVGYHEVSESIRPFFDRVEIERPPRALAPDILPDSLLAVGWRRLWVGTQTDLVGGIAWSDHAGVAHNQKPSENIGNGLLNNVSLIETNGALIASDRDAISLIDSSALVVVLKGPVVDGVLFERASSSSGWRIEALSSGSVRLTALAPGLSVEVPNVLGGS